MAITGLFAASAAQAATVYDADGVNVSVFGDVEVQIKSKMDKAPATKNVMNVDDADFGFTISNELGNNLTLSTTMKFNGERTEAVKLDKAFMALTGDFGTVSAGNQVLIMDDASIHSKFEFGLSTYAADDAARQVIKYQGRLGCCLCRCCTHP